MSLVARKMCLGFTKTSKACKAYPKENGFCHLHQYQNPQNYLLYTTLHKKSLVITLFPSILCEDVICYIWEIYSSLWRKQFNKITRAYRQLLLKIPTYSKHLAQGFNHRCYKMEWLSCHYLIFLCYHKSYLMKKRKRYMDLTIMYLLRNHANIGMDDSRVLFRNVDFIKNKVLKCIARKIWSMEYRLDEPGHLMEII